MMFNREDAIKELLATLTERQLDLLRSVIETADVQGDWMWNGEDSVYEDDVASTLNCLAAEFKIAEKPPSAH